MNVRDVIHHALAGSDMVVQMYLGDLSDADLLVRPVPGINHIAWQMGHLIVAEHQLMSDCYPGKMPPLPAGFKEKYTSETSKLDDAAAFDGKAQLLKLYQEQRAGTLKLAAEVTEADLDKPAPEKLRSHFPTVGDIFLLQGNHWLMHAGQWAVTRRKLGKPPLF
jgi:hypothetical protein